MRHRLLRYGRAVRSHLPRQTVRMRLTFIYGGLFLLSGAALLVITALLWGRGTGGRIRIAATIPDRILYIAGPRNLPLPPPPNGDFIYEHGISLPVSPPPAIFDKVQQVAGQLRIVAADQHRTDLHQLLLYSGIALAIVAMFAIGLGWLMAGRVLRPLRTITSTARKISATNLHERLGLTGPNDELKELGETFDQLLERLDQSFQSQRLFVANASHELRTPIATMRASLDVALAKPGPVTEPMATLADRLGKELDQVDRLLESFLALAQAQRPTDGDVRLSLDRLAAAALESHAGTIADMGLEVHEEDCPEAWVAGDETLITRMVGNLIDNAVRHNEQGGFIRVRTAAEGARARLTVENSGLQIDGAAVIELAKPFRRLGADRTGSDTGSGLGLSIVAAIAETHSGRLELRPLDGGGLQAVVELPLVRASFVRASA